jgi:predicted homoserine dehydrogenase-like protein
MSGKFDDLASVDEAEPRNAIQKEIRVGIVGADTKASWAKVSHVPAINDLPGLKLAAVATQRVECAASG